MALRAASLRDVAWTTLELTSRFERFDDFWAPFLAGVGPAPVYLGRQTATVREEIAEQLHMRLGDGPIELPMRAWAVRGLV